MAGRCGCGSQCSCSVVAGPGVAVTGTGSATDPYVVSSAAGASLQVSDTPTVDMTLSGAGTLMSPYVVSAEVEVSAAPGNTLTVQADGLAVLCEDIQDCIGQALGDGLEYDDAANEIRAKISADGGNELVIGSDGGLWAPGGGPGGGLSSVSTTDSDCIDFSGNGTPGTPLTATPVIAAVSGNLLSCAVGGLRAVLATQACGLVGDGTPGSPLGVNVGTWAWPCDIDTHGGGVYCDSDGRLRADPPSRFYFDQQHINTSYANLAVPAGMDVAIEDRTLIVDNPDPCRDAYVILEFELDVDFNLPASGGAAASGIATDEVTFVRNSGSTAINDAHTQVTKVIDNNPVLAPGASFNGTLAVTMGRGAGGATYNRIQTFIRAFKFAL